MPFLLFISLILASFWSWFYIFLSIGLNLFQHIWLKWFCYQFFFHLCSTALASWPDITSPVSSHSSFCQMLLNQSNQVGKARADFAFSRKRPIGSLSEKTDATGSFFYTVNRITPAAVNSVSGTKCWRDSARSTLLCSKWVNTKACSRCSDLLYLGRTECSVRETLKYLPRICHLVK